MHDAHERTLHIGAGEVAFDSLGDVTQAAGAVSKSVDEDDGAW